MTDYGLDFGLIIAYLVPGFVTLVGASYFSNGVRSLLAALSTSDRTASTFVVTLCLALAIGMAVSVLRGGTLDRTFNCTLPFVAPPIARQELDYPKLAVGGRLAAYLEAKSFEKRPYQFYGNALLATLTLAVGLGRAAARSASRRPQRILAVLLLALLTGVILYPAARRSHYRYMKAVQAFNVLPMSDK